MDYIDVAGTQSGINLFPKNIVEEISQNIRIILITPKGSQPLDRNFGIDVSLVDDPLSRSAYELRLSIMESLNKYEPRIEVTSVSFVPSVNDAANGKLTPKVRFRIKDEYLS